MSGFGFTEDDQEQIALEAAARSNKRKTGLGFVTHENNDPTPEADEASLVAQHYNSRKDTHRTLYTESPVLHLKNINNFVKSVLIQKYCAAGSSVLDFACGKGGDLLKYAAAKIKHYVGCDIAYESLVDAVGRYNADDLAHKRAKLNFPALFFCGDMCQDGLLAGLDPRIKFDLVSCQFALHYSFKAAHSARQALATVSARLRPGGYFFGTTTDANVLIRKLRESDGLEFKNEVYSVKFDHRDRITKDNVFGQRYVFSLEAAVDNCPEYLVHFPTLVELAKEYDLELVERKNFLDFFEQNVRQHLDLCHRMHVLNEEGTISLPEWQTAYLYATFVFRKAGQAGPVVADDPSAYAAGHQRVNVADIRRQVVSTAAVPPCEQTAAGEGSVASEER